MILYLLDTVDPSEKEREDLRVVEYYYLHHNLLKSPQYLRAIQVTISTIAAITHTAFVGNIDATISPAEKAIGTPQLLHRLMIFTSLHTTRKVKKCYH